MIQRLTLSLLLGITLGWAVLATHVSRQMPIDLRWHEGDTDPISMPSGRSLSGYGTATTALTTATPSMCLTTIPFAATAGTSTAVLTSCSTSAR